MARSGGTCTVVKLVVPSGIASVSVPWITLPATVTCLTLLASRYCWNWLYGITSEPPPPPLENRPSAVITTSPTTISQMDDGNFGFGAGTRCLPIGWPGGPDRVDPT